jgi:hypothetical protein
VRMLHDRIRGETGPPERVVLTARLIVRDSCARFQTYTSKGEVEKARPEI